jgi:hypothetical protein
VLLLNGSEFFTHLSPIVVDVELDLLRNREVQLFHQTTTGRLRNAISVTLAVFLNI